MARRAGGTSQRQIARDLNSEGIPAKRGAWTQGTVSKLLRSPVYAGRVRLKGKVHDGLHQAIVDEETWRRVEALTSRSTSGRRTRGPPTCEWVEADGIWVSLHLS